MVDSSLYSLYFDEVDTNANDAGIRGQGLGVRGQGGF
jgi:hypothetical protein